MADDHDTDRKIAQIRQAARELFLQHGFSGVSTAALARHAGVSKETLYSRYRNKEAVLADVLEHLIIAGPDPAELSQRPLRTPADLRHALLHLAGELSHELLQRDYVELVRIVIAVTPRLPHIGDIFRQSVADRAFRVTLDVLTRGRGAGLIRDVDTLAAARMFIAPLVLHTVINVLLVAPSVGNPPPALDVGTHVDLFLAAIGEPDTPAPNQEESA